MKKGFTLIELLAVIVILAIISLIVVPIMINIINSFKIESQKRSINLYANALKNSIIRYNMTNAKPIFGKFSTTDGRKLTSVEDSTIKLNVEYNGSVLCNNIVLETDGNIFLSDCIVNGSKVDYSVGEELASEIYGPPSYFQKYDGEEGLFDFDKTNIVSFSRNTTLNKNEVLDKNNVKLISNTEENKYRSEKEIYGWVENNHFYWWSEAKIVYFHPETMNGFKNFLNIETIDLTGTSTSVVENFSYWFYSDLKLNKILGKINTKGIKKIYREKNYSVAFESMFEKCKNMINIDLSEFHTENATDMEAMFRDCEMIRTLDFSSFNTSSVKYMNLLFYGCHNLEKLDVSNFDTSKVINMYCMFLGCKKIRKLDLSNFNTSNVINFSIMFKDCISLDVIDVSNFNTRKATEMDHMFNNSAHIIVLGENFDTSKVTQIWNMFTSNDRINIIYAKRDFEIGDINSDEMFLNSTTLVGGYNTNYQTNYNPNYIDKTYARISNNKQQGYFTYYNSLDDIKYNITYDLNGGTADNLNYHYIGQEYVLIPPEKEGYFFAGWTGSNGNNPQKRVVINKNDVGDKHYEAHYVEIEQKINIPGPCTFRGENLNIIGDNCKQKLDDQTIVNYTNYKYIDTGIQLFSVENRDKDFEISFTINNIDENVTNNTLVTDMYEVGAPYPGFVYRINKESSKLQLRAGYNGNNNWEMPYNTKNVKISRISKVLYYSIDGGNLIPIVDFNNYAGSFDYPLIFGAGLDETKKPRRYFKGTLSNISIKME